MQPELIYDGLRVKTPDGTGRIVLFFEEDPDIVVCRKHSGGKRELECKVKMDEGLEEKTYAVSLVVELME